MPKARSFAATQTLESALETRDFRAAEQIIMGNIWELYTWQYELLVRAISALPNRILERNPLLRLLHPMTAVIVQHGRPFLPSLGADAVKHWTPEQLDILVLVQMFAARFGGDEAGSLAHATRLTNRLATTRSDQRDDPSGPLWYFHFQIGSTQLAAGDTSAALVELATAQQLARLTPLPDAERLVLGRIALAYALRGVIDGAGRTLSRVLEMPDPRRAHEDSTRSTERTARALIETELMSPEAEQAVAQLDSYGSVQMTWAMSLLARTRYLNAVRRSEEALEAVHLTRLTHPAHRGAFARDVFESATIDAYVGTGELAEAEAFVRDVVDPGVMTRLALTRLALQQGDAPSATRHLRQLPVTARVGVSVRIERALLNAWIQYTDAGSLDENTAQRLIGYAHDRSNRRLFSWLPSQLVREVRRYVAEGDLPRFDECLSGLYNMSVPRPPKLTDGEIRVLQALPHHRTTASIAEEFHLSPNTIKTHLQSLYRKLECSSRQEAMQEAARLNLLGVPAAGQRATAD